MGAAEMTTSSWAGRGSDRSSPRRCGLLVALSLALLGGEARLLARDASEVESEAEAERGQGDDTAEIDTEGSIDGAQEELGVSVHGDFRPIVSYLEVMAAEDEVNAIKEKLESQAKELAEVCCDDEPAEDARRYRLLLAYFPLDRMGKGD